MIVVQPDFHLLPSSLTVPPLLTSLPNFIFAVVKKLARLPTINCSFLITCLFPPLGIHAPWRQRPIWFIL